MASTKPLFASYRKVYPKAVTGRYRTLKTAVAAVLLILFVVAPWLRWDRGAGLPDQAILADMASGRLYFLWLEAWSTEIYYLTGLLFMGAIGLFLATALAGRVWCGYSCPQTVWTDIFLRIERLTEGDRSMRIRLDQGKWTPAKVARKGLKHALWLLVSVVTAVTWVGFFMDMPTLVRDLAHGTVGEQAAVFIGIFTVSTYLLAGFAREQVCTYMCPWPRIQAAMLDEHSLVVTYRTWRGEGREPVRKSETWSERQARGAGDCVDCKQCVQVCPVGIDIRDGLQMACIGCGLCADACDSMMNRVGGARGLVAFAAEASESETAAGRPVKTPLLRPRTAAYGALLAATAAGMMLIHANRSGIEASVLRDRAPLFVTLSNGDVQNAYTVRVGNRTHDTQVYTLSVAGLPGASAALMGAADTPAITAERGRVETGRLVVRQSKDDVRHGSTPITVIFDDGHGDRARVDTVFIAPERRD